MWVRQLVKHFAACLIILRSYVHDVITFDSLVNFDPNLVQMIFDMSLIQCKKNGVKRIIERKMAMVESMGHDKVLAHFGTLDIGTNEILYG